MILDPDRVAPVSWRNGAGSTRELAIQEAPAGETLWRISLAELEKDAPFSRFPGLDRVLVALGPAVVTVDGVEHTCEAGDQVRFAGESPAAVSVAEPTRALNVMTRRARCRAVVEIRACDAPLDPTADATVLLGELAADVRILRGRR